MNPTHLKWNTIACAISIAIRWHFSTYVYNSIDESFPCSLVLMCYSCQLSTTFASKMLFSISNALNKERKKHTRNNNNITLKMLSERDGAFDSNHILHHYRSYVHILYANLRSSSLLNVKYAHKFSC